MVLSQFKFCITCFQQLTLNSEDNSTKFTGVSDSNLFQWALSRFVALYICSTAKYESVALVDLSLIKSFMNYSHKNC